ARKQTTLLREPGAKQNALFCEGGIRCKAPVCQAELQAFGARIPTSRQLHPGSRQVVVKITDQDRRGTPDKVRAPRDRKVVTPCPVRQIGVVQLMALRVQQD